MGILAPIIGIPIILFWVIGYSYGIIRTLFPRDKKETATITLEDTSARAHSEPATVSYIDSLTEKDIMSMDNSDDDRWLYEIYEKKHGVKIKDSGRTDGEIWFLHHQLNELTEERNRLLEELDDLEYTIACIQGDIETLESEL